MSINVTLDRVATPIDREVFAALLEQSVVRSYAKVAKALETGSISRGHPVADGQRQWQRHASAAAGGLTSTGTAAI